MTVRYLEYDKNERKYYVVEEARESSGQAIHRERLAGPFTRSVCRSPRLNREIFDLLAQE